MLVQEAFRLELDEETHSLTASYTPGKDGGEPPSWEMLVSAARARGWGTEVLDQARAVNFLEVCRESEAPVLANVGEICNGSFKLEIALDRMSALLSVSPPRGGRPVTPAEVQARLAEMGIVYGVDEGRIAQAVARDASLVIAQGTPPTLGVPARFESLLEEPKACRIEDEDDDDAVVDYREQGNLTLVSPGTPLMRRIPAEQGQPGLDVLGEAVPPAEVPDLPFASDLAGAAIDKNDPCLLLAASAGVPMIVRQGVQVNSLVEVECVDLSTGNIVFDGTLKVRGDITAGMEVRVSGDIVVQGTVEAARVQAGGDICVGGGIIGMAESRQQGAGDQAALHTAHVCAGGSIKARFIANAVIDAGKSVAAEREIRQSRVYAGESVTVGQPRSSKGTITGGEIHATQSVSAGSIGSPSAVPTMIRVGMHPHAKARLEQLQQRRDELVAEKDKLEKLIGFLCKQPAKDANGMGERARATYASVAGQLVELDAEEAQWHEQFQPLATASIVAFRRYCGGVTLHVGGKVLSLLEDRAGGQAVIDQETAQAVIRQPK